MYLQDPADYPRLLHMVITRQAKPPCPSTPQASAFVMFANVVLLASLSQGQEQKLRGRNIHPTSTGHIFEGCTYRN